MLHPQPCLQILDQAAHKGREMLGLPDVPWNGLLEDMVGKDRVGKLRVVVTTFLSL